MMKRTGMAIMAAVVNVMFLQAQEIKITEYTTLEQVYDAPVKSEKSLPFNELNKESGYVLYEAIIKVNSNGEVLELENVRDYAAVYTDSTLQGTITDNDKKLPLNITAGEYTLRIYTENIGRITYGPEILDNSKGLFGGMKLDGVTIKNWTITPLNIREADVQHLKFSTAKAGKLPGFYKGIFDVTIPKDQYLDMSGWGMGEVWINGQYIGAYWEKEKLQSIQVVADLLQKGKNEVVVFEMKNNNQKTIRLTEKPVFK
ncbi:hypothetical protein U0035_22885 [Niabella yanshanensis]|uniref:Beta-galactosidase n=1 Tax=Niabella yanshanensis TaxID=577386 RepID=A0ABZ0W5F7_9BACT|nr:hypothetical protein [Niabella yanshanensis]WQD38523.1 hypothetical protein U0035_22885 [Niabella yanshanensis]